MTIERWAFCPYEMQPEKAKELPNCSRHDELVAYPDDQYREGLGVIVYRNGDVTNRWSDGTAGVPNSLIELADAEDCLYDQSGVNYDVWRDVEVSDTGHWAGWADPWLKKETQNKAQ